jgi:hypothetical protein
VKTLLTVYFLAGIGLGIHFLLEPGTEHVFEACLWVLAGAGFLYFYKSRSGTSARGCEGDNTEHQLEGNHALKPYEVILIDGMRRRVMALSRNHAMALVVYGRCANTDSAVFDPSRQSTLTVAVHPTNIIEIHEVDPSPVAPLTTTQETKN